MKVNINEIKKDGLVLEEIRNAKSLDVERSDIIFDKPIQINAKIKRELNNIQLHIEIGSKRRFICSRCLEEVENLLEKKVDMIHPLEGETVIDITEIAREEIILDYPLNFLCRPDCKGLCFHCGSNLNEGFCKCQIKSKLAERSERKLRCYHFRKLSAH